MADPGSLGSWLRQQREARFWSRAEMARRLIRAAQGQGDKSVPSVDHISHNIYRWERGVVGVGEHYRSATATRSGFRSLRSAGVPSPRSRRAPGLARWRRS